jgi:hypothetical protein
MLVGGLVAALAVLAPPAMAASGAGGTPGPSLEGGSQYGAPIAKARPARPVATRFAVSPRAVVAPGVPTVAVRIDEPGAATVRARIVFLPLSETGSIVRVDLGAVPVGKLIDVAWPSGVTLAPGRYLARLHVRGLGDAVLARSARLPGRTMLTVRAPAPLPATPPAPTPGATGHAFPVAGPHTYGDVFGAPRNGYSHQGQDVLAAEGVPVVAPVSGTISFTGNQPSAAGYYIVLKGTDGYDYFFAHCQAGSTVVSATQAVVAGQTLCNVGRTGDASGPHLHLEMWVGGWRVGPASHPIDPLPFLKAWDAPAS